MSPKIKRYENLKQAGMKLVSLLVSMKYQFAVCATVAFFLDKMDAWLWVATVSLASGIRGWEKLNVLKGIWLKKAEPEADSTDED